MAEVVKGILEVTRHYVDEFNMMDTEVVYLGLFEDSSGHLQVESLWDEFCPKALNAIDTDNMTLKMLPCKETETFEYRYSLTNDKVPDVERYLENYQGTFEWCNQEEFSRTLGFTVR